MKVEFPQVKRNALQNKRTLENDLNSDLKHLEVKNSPSDKRYVNKKNIMLNPENVISKSEDSIIE
jgi:hypothetical protein